MKINVKFNVHFKNVGIQFLERVQGNFRSIEN